MSRTTKDAKKQLTTSNGYEVVRRNDGSFDILHNGKLVYSAIPDSWLEHQLARYGICGQEFRDAYTELHQDGRVKLIY